MTFIKKVQKKRDAVIGDKEKVLARIKDQVEFSASLGYSQKEMLPSTLYLDMLGALNRDVDTKEFNEILSFVLGHFKGEGFDVSVLIPGKDDTQYTSLRYVITW